MSTLARLEEIKTIPASIAFDFESVKALVVAHLERFNGIVVTEDTVKESKELIKEINVTRKQLETVRKEEISKASEPIKVFDANMKELVSLHDTLKSNLQEQIAKFEDEQKKIIEMALVDALVFAWTSKGVRQEFQNARIEHLILLGSFTASGKLTAKAQGEINQLASNDFAMQAQTDLRVSQLAATCYQAGLAAPLTQGHIQHFMFDDEVNYQTKLNALLASEIAREKQAVEHRLMQQQREAERIAMQEAAQQGSNTEKQIAVEPVQQEAHQQPARSGSVVITCTFALENVPAHVTTQKIEEQLTAKLLNAGFTTLTSMTVERA